MTNDCVREVSVVRILFCTAWTLIVVEVEGEEVEVEEVEELEDIMRSSPLSTVVSSHLPPWLWCWWCYSSTVSAVSASLDCPGLGLTD